MFSVEVNKEFGRIVIKTDDSSVKYMFETLVYEDIFTKSGKRTIAKQVKIYDNTKDFRDSEGNFVFIFNYGWASYILQVFKGYMSKEDYDSLVHLILSDNYRTIPFPGLRDYQNEDILHVLKYNQGLISCFTSYGDSYYTKKINKMGKKKYNFTKEDLIHHYESGMLMKQVAELYKINKETLRKIHIKLGINIKDFKNAGKFRKLTKEKLIEHYKNGDSINELSRIYGVSTKLVHDRNNELGINISDYYDCRVEYDVHIFSKIDTEEKAYWLGFLYADGNVRKEPHNSTISLYLSEVDLDHIKKFKTFMKDMRSDDVIKHQQREKSSGGIRYMVSYHVCSGFLRDDLIKLGCVPAKSLILTFPNKDIFETDELVYDFIRGYVDGDGCLYKTWYNRLGISIRGTLDMLEGIRSYFPEFAKVYSEVDKRTNNTLYRLDCCSDKADLVAQKLYGKATIYLDRKYDKYAALCKLYSEKSGNIGEGCDANTEITDETSKGLSVL